MESIIDVMTNKYCSNDGARSVASFREILDKEELDEWDMEHWDCKSHMENGVLLNFLSHAYKKGLLEGKKLSDISGMNEIDAVTFAIKQLQKVKDDLKVSIAAETVGE